MFGAPSLAGSGALSPGRQEARPLAGQRARLKSYDEWLEIRDKHDPPLAEDSIHRLPFMNAEKTTALIEAGISTIDAIADTSVLGRSTRRYLSALVQGARTVDEDALDRSTYRCHTA